MEELNNLEKELKSMDTRLTEMEDKIDGIDKKLTQVVDAILGNPLTKQGGFIEEVKFLKQEIIELKIKNKVLEEKQAAHDLFRSRVYWTLGIFGFVALVIKFFSTIYSNLFQ